MKHPGTPPETTQGLHGATFKAEAVCDQCFSLLRDRPFPLDCFCGAQDALAVLVELKRLRDSGTAPAEYERRKLAAWTEAFRVCGIIEAPKP